MVLLVEEMMEVPTQHYKMDTHHCVLCDSLFAHSTRRAFFFLLQFLFYANIPQGSQRVISNLRGLISKIKKKWLAS